jgi:vitamin B12 transporter
MRTIRSGALCAAISTFVVSFSAHADIARGDELVVTATRVEQRASEVIGSVSVITRADIERRAVQSLQDLLRGETGFNVANNGGLGKLSNVFVRGADAEQVLVLVDGVRIGGVTAGTASLEYLPVDQIERIEIIRGPRSSLYGSDAIGGVIQIFTRRNNSPSISVGFGSNETSNASAGFGASSDSAWFSVSANQVRSEGFNSCSGSPLGGGCFTYEPDRDGYDNRSGSLRGGYRWQRADIEASMLYATGTSEYDSTFSNETDFTESAFALRGNVRPSEHWSLSFLMGTGRDDQENFYADAATDAGREYMSRFHTKRRNASLQSDIALTNAQNLTFGFDYLDDRIEGTTEYDAKARDNLGAFAQYQLQLGAHRLLGSLRYDDNEQFGGHQTGNFGWKWAFSENWYVTAGYGTAFGAPTFNDLYYPGFSNPHLEPETSRSIELGAGWRSNAMHVAVSAFENRIDDLVVYDFSIFAPNNLNRARVRGLEADLDASFGAWTLAAGYTALDPRNRTPGVEFGNFLPRRARHSGHVELGRGFGALDARARVTAASGRYDNIANTVRTGGYAVVDLIADYRFSPAWSVQAKVGNVFDRSYETARFYYQDDRNFFVTLRYQAH